MNDDVVVSVLCIAYNHEKYIRSALDGFVNQKTNFRYEVLINDDASTDHTAAIIAEYEAKYPDIIKPVYQTENLRVYSSRKAFFSLGRRESIRRSVKATTIGAMKTNCKSRWIFWNRMRGMRPVCTIPGCWTAARAVRGRCIKENRIVTSHSRRSSITVQPVSIRPRFYAGESGSAYRMNSEQMDSAIIRVQFICG